MWLIFIYELCKTVSIGTYGRIRTFAILPSSYLLNSITELKLLRVHWNLYSVNTIALFCNFHSIISTTLFRIVKC